MKIFVVMQNDGILCAFSDESDADNCAAQKRRGAAVGLYYRVEEITLDEDPPASTSP
jgi:hypothetical protein